MLWGVLYFFVAKAVLKNVQNTRVNCVVFGSILNLKDKSTLKSARKLALFRMGCVA